MEFYPVRRNGEFNLSPSYRLIWTAAIVIAVALICTALIFSYLAAVGAESAKCAGLSSLAGYRGGVEGLFGFPLFGATGFGVLFFALRTVLKRASTIELLATSDLVTVFGRILAP